MLLNALLLKIDGYSFFTTFWIVLRLLVEVMHTSQHTFTVYSLDCQD